MAKDKTQFLQYGLIHVLIFTSVLLVAILFLVFSQIPADTEQEIGNQVRANDANSINANWQPATDDSPHVATSASTLVIVQETSSAYEKPQDCSLIKSDSVAEKCSDSDSEDSETGNTTTESASQPPETTRLTTIEMGQPFAFAYHRFELEVSVNGFRCESLHDIVINLSTDRSLENIVDDMRRYKDDSLSLAQRLSIGNAAAVGYLDSFGGYLQENLLEIPLESIEEYLYAYKECYLSIVAKNIGSDSYFPDSCGLFLARYISLVDSREAVHTPHDLRGANRICQKIIIDFPTNATAKSEASFILPAATQITAAVFENTNMASGKTVIRITSEDSRTYGDWLIPEILRNLD